MRSRRPAPGGGVGGFASIPSPHYESSHDNSRHNTADYTHWFDPTSSTHSHSSSPTYEAAGVSEGVHAEIWATYNKVSQEFDEKRLKKWNEDLDVLLIFVSLVVKGDRDRRSLILIELTHDIQSSLFSAIVTAFLIRSLDDLEPDYQQQAALLLYQLLNGRDPNLADISDPTVPKKLTAPAIAVNCLWCASLTISLCASIYAMSFKWWLTEYNGGANPVGGLLRACRRHTQFMAFERLNVHALVAFLPTLLLHSINMFFMGGVIYLWQINKMVMIVFAVVGGTFITAYILLISLPSVTSLPLFHYPAFISYRPSVAIGKVAIFIVGVFVRLCCITLRCVTGVVLFPFVQTVSGTGTLHHWYMQTQTISPGEHKRTRVRQAIAFRDSPDDINTSQKAQEEAILWLSQVPLDPSESKALVSNLALISSSHSYGGFQEPVIVLANLVLEALFREEVSQEQTNTAIDCVVVLGNIKFQSVVDRNSDCDHNIGGIPVPPSVAWAAQQLTIDAFRADFDTIHSGGIRRRLLTAAAWLSPVDRTGDVSWDGRELKIQDRSQFIEEIRVMLEWHVRSDKPLDNKILINLIHGMHACIPRGNYGSTSSIVPFLSFFCEDYDSPWSKDEAVVRALITYALDLLLPSERRKPLVGRRIGLDDLASELIDALMANTTYSDIVALVLCLARRVPYAFRSRKTVLTDIACIWLRTNQAIPEDYRERLNFHATDAFIAVAQHHVVANGGLPRLTDYTPLRLLSAALESGYSRQMTIYTMAMILTLGTSTQVTTVTSEIEVGSITHALFSGRGDLEKGTTEEGVVDIRIYSTLILLKLSPTVGLDVEKVKGLIVQTEEAIGDPSVSDPGAAKGAAKSSEANICVDLDRARWKAIYLSALLFKFLPGDEREKYIKGLRTRVRALMGSGELSFMGDYGRCLEPFGMDVSELGTPAAEQQGQMDTVFEGWIGGFPLFRLAGAVSGLPPGQMHDHPSFFNPRRWFG